MFEIMDSIKCLKELEMCTHIVYVYIVCEDAYLDVHQQRCKQVYTV